MKHVVLAGLLLASSQVMADEPSREDSVAEVQVKLADTAGKTLLAAGGMLTGHGMTAEHRSKNDEEHLTLAFDTSVSDRLVVRAHWVERIDDSNLTWDPVVRLKRGAETTVRFDFPGGSRVMTISAR